MRIAAIDVLAPLYQRVLVPEGVARELQQNNTPSAVRTWIGAPPTWCEIRPDLPTDPSLLAFLDPGEGAAITLALSIQADRLLIDDLAGRLEAERRYMVVTGTLGVLADAHLGRECRHKLPNGEPGRGNASAVDCRGRPVIQELADYVSTETGKEDGSLYT